MGLIKTRIKKYLEGLNDGDMDVVISQFDPDAIVKSPLYGLMPAIEFFAQLENDTDSSRIEPLAFFEDEFSNKGVAHFIYNWRMANGQEVMFECADVFEFTESGQICHLTILYDKSALEI